MARFDELLKRIGKHAWAIAKIIYFPVYLTGYVLCKAARLSLGLSYFLMFDFRMGWDVIKLLFGPNLPRTDE